VARTILHADLDAFYASVEQLDNPGLRGRPVVVGGAPESRGVVAAASYEARAFGVRSAMPMSTAMRLCPDAVRVPPRFERYGDLSRRIMAIFRALTPLVEPLSLDEAFLDISGWVSDGADPERIARELKSEVKHDTQLTVSIGVGSSKSVAKIASDLGKPDGLLVVPPGTEQEFLAPLPVRVLWGVGPKTERTLLAAGIRSVGDMARRGEGEASRILGSHGVFLREMARGIDDRGIETERERKSVGAETTFARDLPDGPELRQELHRIVAEVTRRLDRAGVRAQTVALKLRYSNFTTVTRQTSVKTPTGDAEELERLVGGLLDAIVQPGDRFRLLGAQCSRLVPSAAVQGELFGTPPPTA
jgi:DNA polymerase-4